MLTNAFSPESWELALGIVKTEFLKGLGETLYITLLSTVFASLLGLPLGVLLAAGGKGGFIKLPRVLWRALDVTVNVLRSVPFLILMIMVIPLTRAIVGTAVGTSATVVPLVIAAFPFVARLFESSLREVSPALIETAKSLGASPLQIVLKVLLPEAVPSLVSNFTIALTTILGYSAMSGMIGGGGIGKIAINYGYYRYQFLVMLLAVIVLVLLVQVFQSLGTRLAKKLDKRNRE